MNLVLNMRRKLITMGIAGSMLILALIIQLISHKQPIEWVSNPDAINIRAFYAIDAEYQSETKTIQATQRITFRNEFEATLDQIYFHIYPNVFKEKDLAPFENSELSFAYPNGFSPGWIEIKGMKEQSRNIDYRVIGDTNTILRATLARPLAPGEETVIEIKFDVQLPNAVGRMGYGDDTVNINNWYPILAVYNELGWHLDPYYPIGDPFYSEVAAYEVKLSIPDDYIVAATGELVKEQQQRGKKIYHLRAENVRDFSIVISRNFLVASGQVDGIEVNSYTLDEYKSKAALQFSIDSIEIFNRLFGKYPYQKLSVVASDFHLGGMEYPNLVMISKDLYQMKEDFPLEYVIAHEIAHQWWYGIVGNNQVKEPWLDEALTEYSTLMYFEEKYGEHIKEQIMEKMMKAQYEGFIALEPDKGEGILRSLKEFDSSHEYSSIVYSKGALFVEALRSEMGDEAFLKSLREYYSAYQFKNATTKDFFEICQSNTEKILDYLFQEWLKVEFE